MDKDQLEPFVGKKVKLTLKSGDPQIAGAEFTGKLSYHDELYMIKDKMNDYGPWKIESIASVSRGI